ncbi:MAG: PAS domain S-box protein [Gemmatimonadetes bacterium]|uniref:histidine kinase n=1 Tax=Candidatus Kutchimonas denitrificans TaxID=3056748 RepID=A0AAE5CBM0_9BACT|nr:PAS domain S-box protein [Gemmatimonadota bacterium]NIR74595.1 PAS domain S-box protein [Candidatus Kutchimonas denitrificans]NIS02785.1 PAS domain S-box protein [Gemmatimonadota bacterium]NIT68946.1 PAS domain S-box protein [Gemmatimonadota bacterium]NIU52251.1 PAS domain S-box protein [Gemmatimonadota bacterium]
MTRRDNLADAQSAPSADSVRRAERHLPSGSDFISAVLDTVGALIVVLDREGRIVLFNQACAKATGYTYAEMEGQPFWEVLLLPDEVPAVKSVFAELAAGNFPNKHVNHWLTREGEARLISWSNTALVGRNREVEFVIGTGIDITEHASLERQLQQAQKMEAVGRLAGGVAHDFGSVLTAINGYVERASRRLDEDDPARSDLQGVLRACDRGSDLIRRLLVFSRRREGKPEALDLDALVAETSGMLRRVIGDDIRLVMDLQAEPGRVIADRSQMEQVLLNLAVNSREAMPEGGELRIRTREVTLDDSQARIHGNVEPGDYVMLQITDTGTGMDAETLSHVFEPFFTTKEDGTGLGLSTVYGIVKGFGGHILVESEEERGTDFQVYLPATS